MNERSLLFLIAIHLLHFTVAIKGMSTAKLPPGIAQKFARFSPPIRTKIIVSAEQKKLNESESKHTIVVYDASMLNKYVFDEEMWNKSALWKKRMKLEDNNSQVFHIDFSNASLKTLYEILLACKNEKNESEWNQITEKKIADVPIPVLVSVLGLMYGLDFNKKFSDPVITKIQKKTTSFFDGTSNDQTELDLLRYINPDLLRDTLGNQWYTFLQKLRFSLAKKKKLGSMPQFHSCLRPDSFVRSILFSPDGKHILICTEEAVPGRLRSDDTPWTYVLDTGGTILYKSPARMSVGAWINDRECAFVQCGNQKGSIRWEWLNTVDVQRGLIGQVSLNKSYLRVITDVIFREKKAFFCYKASGGQPAGVIVYDYGSDTPLEVEVLTSMEGADSSMRWIKMVLFSGGILLVLNNKNTEHSVVLEQYSLDNGKLNKGADIEAFTIDADYRGDICCATSSDGKKIAIAQGPTEFTIYDRATRNKIKHNLSSLVYSLDFSPDGKIVMVSSDNRVYFFSAVTGDKIGQLDVEDGQAFKKNDSVALSRDGNTLAIGSDRYRTVFTEVYSPNLLIWKCIPEQYIGVFKELQDETKYLPFDLMKVLVPLYYKSQQGDRRIVITDEEEKVINQVDKGKLMQMLIDGTYVVERPKQEIQENELSEPMKNNSPTPKSWWDYFTHILLHLR
jgi:WD40 repeat protein